MHKRLSLPSVRPDLLQLAAVFAAGAAVVPLIAIIGALFAPSPGSWQHLAGTTLPAYLANSFGLMLITGGFSIIVGAATAWLVTATRFPGRNALDAALVLPLAAPGYIIAYVYTDILDVSGPVQTALRGLFSMEAVVPVLPNVRSLWGAGLMLGLVLYPYVYLLARAAFLQQSASGYLAARTLGAGPWRAFVRVALPGARPAIAGGAALVLMETLADFGVADYFAIPTFSTGIYRTWLGLGDITAALKLAAILLVFVALLVAAERLAQRGRVDDAARSRTALEPAQLNGWRALAAASLCGAPVLFGFVIPVGVLLFYALTAGDPSGAAAFLGYAFASGQVALFTCFLATLIALLLAYCQRQQPGRPLRLATRAATLGYALPGTLLAVGLLGPIGSVDRWLTGVLHDIGLWEGGLVLAGTTALLIYAYLIRFLTVSYNAVSTALEKVSPTTDAAARSLGARPLRLLGAIHVPLIRPGVAAALLLVFVDVMRELPATLILRPFNFETLATRVYRLASDERLSEASTAALAIILVGLLPTLLLSRVGRR